MAACRIAVKGYDLGCDRAGWSRWGRGKKSSADVSEARPNELQSGDGNGRRLMQPPPTWSARAPRRRRSRLGCPLRGLEVAMELPHGLKEFRVGGIPQTTPVETAHNSPMAATSWPARISGMTSDNDRRAANSSALALLSLIADPSRTENWPDSVGIARSRGPGPSRRERASRPVWRHRPWLRLPLSTDGTADARKPNPL